MNLIPQTAKTPANARDPDSRDLAHRLAADRRGGGAMSAALHLVPDAGRQQSERGGDTTPTHTAAPQGRIEVEVVGDATPALACAFWTAFGALAAEVLLDEEIESWDRADSIEGKEAA
jgi:hypothetical protein